MQKENSVYYQAANFGLSFGLLLTLASGCFIMMQRLPSLSVIISVILIVCIPVYLYRGMIRLCRKNEIFSRFVTLWVFGIYSFIFATLICALITAFYLIIFEPTFIYDSMNSAIASLKSIPAADIEYSSQIDIMQKAVDRHLLPSPMEFVISMSWTSCFFGSMLSIPLAFLASRNISLGKRDSKSAF